MSGVMRRILVFMALILVFMMSCVSYALASTNDEAKIKSTLNNAGISQPVQFSNGAQRPVSPKTEGVKRLVVLERHDGACGDRDRQSHRVDSGVGLAGASGQ